MVSRPTGAAVLLTLLSATLLTGCCPSGSKVLESMTLLPEEQEGCALVRPEDIDDVPIAPVSENPLVTSISSKGELLASEMAGVRIDGVRNAYVAVYECEPGGPRVRVYAVLFNAPADAERAAALEDAGAMHKGQLAGMVVPDDDACESCYDAVVARAQGVLGK